MKANPRKKPMTAPPMPTGPSFTAATPIPTTANDPVSTLGMRRVRRSMTAARPVAAQTIDRTMTSDIGCDDIPKHCFDRSAHRRERSHHHQHDERDQQCVLEQILAVFTATRLAPPLNEGGSVHVGYLSRCVPHDGKGKARERLTTALLPHLQ